MSEKKTCISNLMLQHFGLKVSVSDHSTKTISLDSWVLMDFFFKIESTKQNVSFCVTISTF